MFAGGGSSSVGIVLHRRRLDFRERDRTILALVRPHIVQGYQNARRLMELECDLAAITSGVDSLDAAVITLGEQREIRFATAKAQRLLEAYFDGVGSSPGHLPPALDAWVRRYEAIDPVNDVTAVRTPYVVARDDRELAVRLIGDGPHRLLLLSERRFGIDAHSFRPLGLTPREAEVLKWLAEGKRDQEIATILAISPRTVQHHPEHVYDKLGVETRNAAVAVAVRASSSSAPP